MQIETGRARRGIAKARSVVDFRQTLSSLRYQDFRRLWLGQLCSSGSQWMEMVARGWLVYQMTGSPFMLGLINALRAVPMLFFGIFGGVLADRFHRRKLLNFAQLANMVLNLILATLIVTGVVQVWHVFLTAFLAGIVMAFQQPARQALIPDLVEEGDLMNAIALNSAAMNMMRSVGPAVAGFLVGMVGMGGSYFVQATLLLLAALLTFPIKAGKPDASTRDASMLSNLKEGLGYVRSNDTVLILLALALIPMLLGMPYSSLMPVFAKDVLKTGPEGLGVLMSAPGIGALIGVMLIASLNNFNRKGILLIGGAGLFGFFLVAFSLSHWLIISLVVLMGVGMSNSAYSATNNTLLQIHTPDELRGRVMSIFLLDRGLAPLGTMMAGTIATFLGAPIAIGVMGGACFLLAAGVAIAKPLVRQLS